MLRIRKLIKNRKGATAIEYGLIAALIAVAAITAMQGLGTSIRTTFNNAASAMNGYAASRRDQPERAVGAGSRRPFHLALRNR